MRRADNPAATTPTPNDELPLLYTGGWVGWWWWGGTKTIWARQRPESRQIYPRIPTQYMDKAESSTETAISSTKIIKACTSAASTLLS